MSTPKDKAPAEPTKPLLSYDECHTIALESVGPIDSAETVRDIYERDRAKLIETLQECVDLIHLSRYDPQWPPLLTDELLSKVKDTHGIEPQKD